MVGPIYLAWLHAQIHMSTSHMLNSTKYQLTDLVVLITDTLKVRTYQYLQLKSTIEPESNRPNTFLHLMINRAQEIDYLTLSVVCKLG